ncbi:hypothetical protein UFOVP1636_131 [uncultured Caudovirales phage]|jgi:hypothetical protein|uniref:Uncharacterized protein n=1 Tax=uncultured Caudovirales phage TaxID=2100421 RepID=A0A6J5T274_9CAUD|nr:hypothetical protein UFOVP1636_131 [uncultured Caudovirales phage]
MKDALLDMVKHTHNLGVIDLIKITGTEEETLVNAIAEDKSVILDATFHGPVAEFIGQFGMPNLGKLNTILNIPEYKEDAQISISRQTVNGAAVPSGIHFENKVGDFKNDYRFMGASIVNDKIKTMKFKDVKWGVDVAPTVLGIQRFVFQSQANSEETTFIAKVEGKDLKFYFGDNSTHAGSFVFETNISGNLTRGWPWPVNVVKNILGLPGDKTMRFSDEGAAQITVDSGIAVYNYTIPAMTK